MCLLLIYQYSLCFQFVASSDKFFMWVDLYSVVDHFTVVPILVGAYLDVNWLG